MAKLSLLLATLCCVLLPAATLPPENNLSRELFPRPMPRNQMDITPVLSLLGIALGGFQRVEGIVSPETFQLTNALADIETMMQNQGSLTDVGITETFMQSKEEIASCAEQLTYALQNMNGILQTLRAASSTLKNMIASFT